MPPKDETPIDTGDALPARVYWLVAIVAVSVMLVLYWFTAVYNIPLGSA